MAVTAPLPGSARALRLRWALPDGGVLPRWAADCARLLEAAGDIRCDRQPVPSLHADTGADAGVDAAVDAALDARLQAPPAADIVLCLDAATAATGCGGDDSAPCWLLSDGDGNPLAHDWPLLRQITAARGILLLLWQRAPPGAGWRCLRRIHVQAPARYGRGVRLLAGVAARLLRQACIDHRLRVLPRGCGGAAPATLQLPTATGAAAARPAAAALLVHRLRGGWRSWRDQQRARWLTESWRIGIVDAPIGRLLDGAAGSATVPTVPCTPLVRWLPAPDAAGYWADPTGVPGEAGQVCCEYFDRRSGVGRIERFELDAAAESVVRRDALPLGGGLHVSFPLVFMLDGRRFGLIETSAQRTCTLHAVQADGSWKPVATLLRNVAAADPAMFFHDGLYWLAFTDIDMGNSDNLCLYHAARLEGPWLPHANNPVKTDVTGSRMAGGFFRHGGALHRPAQDGLSTYGAAVGIFRVVRCTPTEYDEVLVRRLAPDPDGPCPHGMHTVGAWGERTLIDGKRLGFSAGDSWRKLRARLLGPAPLAR